MSVFDKLIPFLQGKLNESGSFILAGKERIPIRKDAFFSLSSAPAKKVVFVDGGNAEFLQGPNVSLQFARFYAGVWENNVRVSREVQECVIAVVLQKKDADVNFEVTVFSMDGEELRKYQFDVFDERVSFGKRRAEPYAVGNLVRKMLEIEFAASMELSVCDLLVRDGELDFDIEETKLLVDSVKQRGSSLLSVSKTCRLCTDSGSSALFVLEKIAPPGVWFYHSGGNIGFAKLHPKSDYVFRVDSFDAQCFKQLSELIANSADASFLGYPYGLIDADKFAQVTKEEISQIKLRFALKSKELFGSLERALDAHDILNKF